MKTPEPWIQLETPRNDGIYAIFAETESGRQIAAPESKASTEEARDYAITFTFLQTHRETLADPYCDVRIESVLVEGGNPYAWTCDGEPSQLPDGLMSMGGMPGTSPACRWWT